MWIIGLTGAIGSGKTTLAAHCQDLGIPVHCADRAVHELITSDPDIFQQIKVLWPTVIVGGHINRSLLGEKIMSSPGSLQTLEGFLYPKLAVLQKAFLDDHKKSPLVILDVPLLLEVGLKPYCHRVVLLVAPKSLREKRVLARPGMTLEKFEFFDTHRMPDAEQCKRADIIISTGRGRKGTLRTFREIVESFSEQPSPVWQGKWPTTLERSV